MNEGYRIQFVAVVTAILTFSAVSVQAITITVTSTADSGPGTLRAALVSAINGDTIDTTSISGTILLTSGELFVTKSVSIVGPGPSNLAINGNASSRVFHFINILNAVISSLSVTNASGFGDGGGILIENSGVTLSNVTISGNSTFASGGGIDLETGSLEIINSTISGNLAGDGGGGINFRAGSGSATVAVIGSTFSGNSAGYIGGGGGIRNDSFSGSGGMLTVIDSTFSGNSTSSYRGGGGIYNHSANGAPATLMIVNSTFSGNVASIGGAIQNDGSPTTVKIGNTILNASTSGETIGNASPGAVISLGYNLSSDTGGGLLTAIGDQIDRNPLLGPLQDNGGPTFTHALLAGSPAIDYGKGDTIPALCPCDTDQRGFPRPAPDSVILAPSGDGSDIGAFEVQPANQPPVARCADVTVSAGSNCMADVSIDNGSFDPDEADTITLSQSPAGPYPLGTTSVTLTVADNHGASNSCTATVTVLDETPPQITCPANVTACRRPPNRYAVVTFAAPAAIDNCGVTSVLCYPPSGSNFPIGTTIVNCIATDTSGNTSSCNFRVIVLRRRGRACRQIATYNDTSTVLSADKFGL